MSAKPRLYLPNDLFWGAQAASLSISAASQNELRATRPPLQHEAI
jgi:hypothetical protein